MRKRLLIISQYFYPENFRINVLAEEWTKRGYQVDVLTGIPNYPDGKFFPNYSIFKKTKEVYNGINIRRLPIFPRGNNSILLILNYISFVISGFFWQRFTRKKYDNIFIFEVSPMTQALPGVWLSKRQKIPCHIYVQDLWPENVQIITGLKKGFIIKLIEKMVLYIYENCDNIFTTSKSFIKAISEKGIERKKIIFWPQFAEDFYQPVVEVSTNLLPANKVNLTFAGNIGGAQGLNVLIEAAEYLKFNRKFNEICFNIIGDGRYKDWLINYAQEKKVIDYFNYIPRKPPEEIPSYLSYSDAAILTLSESSLLEMTIPAKLQSYMACGVPIIGSLGGEAADIICEAKCGLISNSGDYIGFAENVVKFCKLKKEERETLAQNARKYYLENFDKNSLLDEMDSFFK